LKMSLELLKKRIEENFPEDVGRKICREIDETYSENLLKLNGSPFSPALAENKTYRTISEKYPLPEISSSEKSARRAPERLLRHMIYRSISFWPF